MECWVGLQGRIATNPVVRPTVHGGWLKKMFAGLRGCGVWRGGCRPVAAGVGPLAKGGWPRNRGGGRPRRPRNPAKRPLLSGLSGNVLGAGYDAVRDVSRPERL